MLHVQVILKYITHKTKYVCLIEWNQNLLLHVNFKQIN